MTDNKPEQAGEHSKEPWKVEQPRDSYPRFGVQTWSVVISDADNVAICTIQDSRKSQIEANARRIVQCVNFCAGLSNETIDELGTAKGEFDHYNKTEDDLRQKLAEAQKENENTWRLLKDLTGDVFSELGDKANPNEGYRRIIERVRAKIKEMQGWERIQKELYNDQSKEICELRKRIKELSERMP